MTETKHHTDNCLNHIKGLPDAEAKLWAESCECPAHEDEVRLDLDGGKYTLVMSLGRTCALRYGEPWRNLTGDNLILNLGHELDGLRRRAAAAAALDAERAERGGDGTVRKAHYGAGRQPWDDIVDQGWGPAFAAGCVTRYLRRDKRAEHSLESARWYYRQLYAHAAQVIDAEPTAPWREALLRLEDLLTQDELRRVRNEP